MRKKENGAENFGKGEYPIYITHTVITISVQREMYLYMMLFVGTKVYTIKKKFQHQFVHFGMGIGTQTVYGYVCIGHPEYE